MNSFVVLVVLFVAAVQGLGARLLASKQVLTNYPAVDQDLVVLYEIFNIVEFVCREPAYDIELTDAFPSNVPVQSGLTNPSWSKLAPGANVTHTVVLKPTTTGYLDLPRAKITYKLSSRGETQVGYTNAAPTQLVETAAQHSKRVGRPHFLEWTIFAILCGISVGPAYMQWKNLAARNGKLKKKSA